MGRAERAIERLRDELDHDPARAVHGARKDLKKLRSLLRLARGGIGGRKRRRINAQLRDAGRLLAGARDAQVMLDTVEKLRLRYPTEFPNHLTVDFVGMLRARQRERVGGGGDQAEAIELIERARVELADWGVKGERFEMLEPGLRRAYERGRAGFDEVASADRPDDEAVHEWRKRVKDHWYHVRLLEPAWPALMRGLGSASDDLAELLGEHHDLSVLIDAAHANEDAFGGGGRKQLVELAERRQGELIERAVPLGRKLYAEKPTLFVRRIRRYTVGVYP